MDKRSQNKELRRRRILFEARKQIAAGNFHTLTTRGLAAAADVSQPTLYNLIGTKSDIIKLLVKESLDRIFNRISLVPTSDPLDAIEAVIIGSVALYSEDETYYRAGAIASDQLLGPISANPDTQDLLKHTLAVQAVGMVKPVVSEAIKEGLLQGRLSSDVISEQLYSCYRSIHRDWVYELISIDSFRTRALRAFYITLAADATLPFRMEIEKRLFSLPEFFNEAFNMDVQDARQK